MESVNWWKLWQGFWASKPVRWLMRNGHPFFLVKSMPGTQQPPSPATAKQAMHTAPASALNTLTHNLLLPTKFTATSSSPCSPEAAAFLSQPLGAVPSVPRPPGPGEWSRKRGSPGRPPESHPVSVLEELSTLASPGLFRI